MDLWTYRVGYALQVVNIFYDYHCADTYRTAYETAYYSAFSQSLYGPHYITDQPADEGTVNC